MRKFTTMMILTGLSFSMTTVALAAPVNLTGNTVIKYEKDTATGDPSISGMMYSATLNGETDIGSEFSLYARLGAQYATQPSLSDYNLDAYGSDRKSVFSLDLFGLNYKSSNFLYKLGRQAVTVGTTSLLYSRSDSNIGKHNFVDGLSATGRAGVLDIAAVAAQEDNVGSEKNKLYAIRTGYKATENFDYGLTLGRYQFDGGEHTNHWAVDGTYKVGKHSVTAEYAKSNSNADNKAYAASWNYGFDDKTAVYITGFKVETNGDMGKQSDFDNDNRGIYYGLTHSLTDADSLEVVYKNQKIISSGQKNTKLEATFTHSF
ncbi:hypothetical protein Ga0466249_001398 [Sporomusaceae bacterium BoRhaA]|uniref:hypothetical protein n=1 Tax=Pelorhabdus rhamnosifermentans TaxID=2772457 RepID=UPI0028A68AC5|nr:hypothetical protein [Pelorhabdus rhamnosifermentans]MBU2700306.1 hypothetical protein [Pelorhabdus rhamnosifermentans]